MRVITEDFVAAGKPDYIRANAGIQYTDITTGIIYRQTTIPYGQNWVVIVKEQVFNGVPSSREVNTNGPLTGGGDLKANRTLGIVKADATHDGYVSAADWSSFNGKVPQTRTITIDGVTQDLSADRTWTTGGVQVDGFMLMGG
jgi:hypothetical protein